MIIQVRALDELVGFTIDALKAECDGGGPLATCGHGGGGGDSGGRGNHEGIHMVREDRGAVATRKESMWDSTFFVFSSDNGPEEGTGASAWPLKGWKRQFWEGGVRAVTFAILPKSMRRESRRPQPQLQPQPHAVYYGMAHLVDWVPTLSELAGVDSKLLQSLNLDGTSLVAGLVEARQRRARGKKGAEAGAAVIGDAALPFPSSLPSSPSATGVVAAASRTMLIGYDNVLRCGAARTASGLKLVLQGSCELLEEYDPASQLNTAPKPEDEWSLYDLATDPYESVDLLPTLYYGEENRSRIAAHAELLSIFQQAMRDAAPPLVFVTPGDKDAAPGLHRMRWVPWLEPENAVTAWCRIVEALWIWTPSAVPWPGPCS